jgi:hypothetical protein
MMSYELSKAMQAERERQVQPSLRRSRFEPMDHPRTLWSRLRDRMGRSHATTRPTPVTGGSAARI